MFIKLRPKSETDKSYQLPNGSWIPKSVLDGRGLKPPFYQVENWWLNKLREEAIKDKSDKDKINKLRGLSDIEILFNDIPPGLLEVWERYWVSKLNSTPFVEKLPELVKNQPFQIHIYNL